MTSIKGPGRPKKKDSDKFSVSVHSRINNSMKEDLEELRQWYKKEKNGDQLYELLSIGQSNVLSVNGHLSNEMKNNKTTPTSESEFIRLLITLGLQSMNFYRKLLSEGWRCPTCGQQNAISDKILINQLSAQPVKRYKPSK